jgi:thymidine kinase
VAMEVGEKDQFVSVCQECHSLEHMGLLSYN